MLAPLTPYALITSYSVESVFLGMNCILYGFCAYTLWGQKSWSCRLLLYINTAQFLLCAIQILCHGTFLFILFTVFTGRGRTYLEHFNIYAVTISITYNINYVIGGILSIWRLYVLYDSNLRVCVPAFICWIGQICASGLVARNCWTVPILRTSFNPVNMLLWVLITTLNLCVAIPICFRLCMAQKNTHTKLSNSLFKSIAIIFVECGTLITLCSVAIIVLYACKFEYALASVGIATEVAVASQLLITARHAMLSQDHYTSSPLQTVFEINIVPAESGQIDASKTPVKTKSLSSHSATDFSGHETLGT